MMFQYCSVSNCCSPASIAAPLKSPREALPSQLSPQTSVVHFVLGGLEDTSPWTKEVSCKCSSLNGFLHCCLHRKIGSSRKYSSNSGTKIMKSAWLWINVHIWSVFSTKTHSEKPFLHPSYHPLDPEAHHFGHFWMFLSRLNHPSAGLLFRTYRTHLWRRAICF